MIRTKLHYEDIERGGFWLRVRQSAATVLWTPMLVMVMPQVILLLFSWFGARCSAASEYLDQTRFYRWLDRSAVDGVGDHLATWVWRKR